MLLVSGWEEGQFWLGAERAWKVRFGQPLGAKNLLMAIGIAKKCLAQAFSLSPEDAERLGGNARDGEKEVIIYLL